MFVARLPIVVSQGATLDIDKQVKELRLSQERGAFLVNDGMLFVRDSKVTGWSESKKEPAWFKTPNEFRPFLISWGGAEVYLSNSTFTSFGYNASKAYGISISQYSPGMDKQMKRPRPKGWVIDSTIVDSWYGFYCYEADDLVVKGNTYRDNIVYGIDPHDRSHRLIIADNTVHGTRKKHGIIVSREVNDSFIFNNRSYENKLSGIVLDRNSEGNLVAYNEVYRNHSDGITLRERRQPALGQPGPGQPPPRHPRAQQREHPPLREPRGGQPADRRVRPHQGPHQHRPQHRPRPIRHQGLADRGRRQARRQRLRPALGGFAAEPRTVPGGDARPDQILRHQPARRSRREAGPDPRPAGAPGQGGADRPRGKPGRTPGLRTQTHENPHFPTVPPERPGRRLCLAQAALAADPGAAPSYQALPAGNLCPAAADDSRYNTKYLGFFTHLVQAQDDWLFRTTYDLRTDFGTSAEGWRELRALRDELKRKGIELVVVYQPTRGLVNREKLSPAEKAGFDYELAKKNYLATIARFRQAGIWTPDFSPLFDEKEEHAYYFKGDHHWTPPMPGAARRSWPRR